MELPEGLDERFRALRRRPKLRAEVIAEAEAAVERVQFVSTDPHAFGRVPLHPATNEPPVRTVAEPGEHDTLIGLDAEGRAVLVRPAFGLEGEAPRPVVSHPSETTDSWVVWVKLLRWEPGRCEVIEFITHRDVANLTWMDLDDAGRPERISRVGSPGNDFGRGAMVATCRWDGDRCVEVHVAEVAESGRRDDDVVRLGEYDDDGLARIHEDGRVVWDRSLHGPEAHPLPVPEAVARLLEATVAAARDVVTEPAWVVRVHADLRERRWGPTVDVITVAARDAAAGRRPARELLWTMQGRHTELLGRFGGTALRAWRSLHQQDVALDEREIAVALQRRLAAVDWPGGAQAIVFAPETAEEVLGRERYGAILAALGEAVPRPEIVEPPATREELADLLRAYDLPVSVADQAAFGLLLVERGTGVSRLGGAPELPLGEPWPVNDGRVLTHLATIDLAEVPEVDDRDLLPADGRLVFLADLTEEGEIWEEVAADDPALRVLYLPAGTPLHEPAEPKDDRDDWGPPARLRRRDVRFQPILTLPPHVEGLTEAQRLGYEELRWKVIEVSEGLDEPGHLLLGHPVVVAEDPRGPDEVSLLRVSDDEALDFNWLDAGDLTFRIARDDLRAGRWERTVVSAESA